MENTNKNKEPNLKCVKCNTTWISDKPRQFSECPKCNSSNNFIVEYRVIDTMQ